MLVASQPYQKQLGKQRSNKPLQSPNPYISYMFHPIQLGVPDIKQTPLSETPKSHNPLPITTKET